MADDKMQRFTQRARRVLSLAHEEAERMHHNYIGTEHLLLGLIREEGGVAGRVLRELGLDPARVKEMVERLSGIGRHAGGRIELAPGTEQVLQLAIEEARRMGHHYIGTEHLLLGMVRQDEGVGLDVLRRLGVTPEQIRRQTRRILQESPSRRSSQPSRRSRGSSKSEAKTPLLDQLATDLTDLAGEGKLDPVIGRETEIERVIQILARRTKNNPALIGEPGVGKTAIVEGLAQRIVASEIPDPLLDKRVLQLDVGSLVAGTMYRGQFEERLKRVIEELKATTAILFIDEVHMLVGAGSAGSSVDAANILKPALSRGELQVIGATTMDEYRKYIESDAALERRFQPVMVEEPSIEETISILRGVKRPYEEHHNLKITDEAIEAAATLSARYVTERFLPDKAIDLIDESASRVRMYKSPEAKTMRTMISKLRETREAHQQAMDEARYDDAQELMDRQAGLEEQLEGLRGGWSDTDKRSELVAEDIAEVVSMWTGVPVMQIAHEESARLLEMEQALHERIVGQDEAIEAISKAVRRSRAGLKDPHRPIGSFIFLGPTGVGKTELTKALAEFIFGSEDALVQIDMSEFMERHNISRLVGAPPGYVGYEEAGQLTEAIRRRPYSIVVFDEIEKAHPEAHNMLLQIMEEGQLTDARGRRVDFRNAIVVMTSNIGAELIQRQTSIGFNLKQADDGEEIGYSEMRRKLMDALRKVFRPEFINRVDAIIVFHALTKGQIVSIVDLEIAKVAARLTDQDLDIRLTDAAKRVLADAGYDPEMGARPLKRVIQREIEDRLSDALLASRFEPGDRILIDADGDELVLRKDEAAAEPDEEPQQAIPAG
ncbi:MAG TPA: ATP-dependent Clp protease ATP-binding subunit [Anaerolineales bacterium]